MADTLKLSIFQINKYPFRLTKAWFQNRTIHSQSVANKLKKTIVTETNVREKYRELINDIDFDKFELQLWFTNFNFSFNKKNLFFI